MASPSDTTRSYRILFVCLGNICRSPAAEGIMQHLVEERGLTDLFVIDSAGTYGGHAGDLPDPRMRSHAARRGYSLEHRSRKITGEDFDRFDLIIGMDDMTEYNRHFLHDHVPDPYYSGADGFELVLDLLEDACDGLLCTLVDGNV